MIIHEAFDIPITKEEIILHGGKKYQRLLKRNTIALNFHLLSEKLPNIIHPIVGYERFPVKGIEHDKIVLENGIKIGGGPVTSVMKCASEIIIGVAHLGDEIDQEIENYQKEKNMIAAVLLDSLGNYCIGQVREKFLTYLQKKYTKEGKFLSLALSPGESEWGIEEQAILFNLLKPDEIKIKLNDSMLMIPTKAVSFMLGVSPISFENEHTSRCDFCMMKDTCENSTYKL